MHFSTILATFALAITTTVSAVPVASPDPEFVIYTRQLVNGVEKRSDTPIAFGTRDPSPVNGGGEGFKIYAQYAREEADAGLKEKREEKREPVNGNGGGGFRIYAQYAREELEGGDE
ncbi:hypothetical protein G7Y89_g2161 [Cudoniella acicularis]|uniref:Uncharacterized protein n=1 Tax=Cudoniella acicularis TaxID=354080 RepID=A0A8H4RTU7_9HELO|nr:hypothetical protein G7Y89_g2161 [Cudoniella acicularis]